MSKLKQESCEIIFRQNTKYNFQYRCDSSRMNYMDTSLYNMPHEILLHVYLIPYIRKHSNPQKVKAPIWMLQ